MINNEEVWAQIEGFPDYAVSTWGRVKSTRWGNLLVPRLNSYGHQRVALYRDQERYDLYIHHLVAAAFITEYSGGGSQIQWSDGDKSNNNVYNLRFSKGRRLGGLITDPPPPRERRVQIKETGLIFTNVEECAKFIGGSASSIYRVLRGDRSTYRGYSFTVLEG